MRWECARDLLLLRTAGGIGTGGEAFTPTERFAPDIPGWSLANANPGCLARGLRGTRVRSPRTTVHSA